LTPDARKFDDVHPFADVDPDRGRGRAARHPRAAGAGAAGHRERGVERAGATTVSSFGDEERQLARFAWFGEGFATRGTHPVGRKPPNAWGLQDVHGNDWEWVRDWYASDALAGGEATDPAGPATGTKRVVRGGSWHSTGDGWRASARRDYAPDYSGISVGMRLVMTAE